MNEVVRQTVQQARQVLIESGIEVGDYNVKMATTSTQYGGKRTWFICPTCERRCGVLLKHPLSRAVGCRECLDVDYRRQRYKGMVEEISTD